MFINELGRSIFEKNQKVIKMVENSKTEAQILPILDYNNLLKSSHRDFIAGFEEYVVIPDGLYDSLYRDLMISFVEFVQAIPIKEESALGSIINRGLLRGKSALKHYMLDVGQGTSHQATMQYAGFSAALLYDIAQVLNNKSIFLCDKKGAALNIWDPFVGSMVKQANFYQIRSSVENYHGGHLQQITVMLARQLMPESGFALLVSNPKAMRLWLDLLSERREGAGGFRHILDIPKKYDGSLSLIDLEFLTQDAMYNQAEDFWAWLREGLQNGTIDLNKVDSNAHLTDSGLVINLANVVDDYNKSVAESDKTVDQAQLLHDLSELGLTDETVNDYKLTDQNQSAAGFMSIIRENPQGNINTGDNFVKGHVVRGILVDAGLSGIDDAKIATSPILSSLKSFAVMMQQSSEASVDFGNNQGGHGSNS